MHNSGGLYEARLLGFFQNLSKFGTKESVVNNDMNSL